MEVSLEQVAAEENGFAQENGPAEKDGLAEEKGKNQENNLDSCELIDDQLKQDFRDSAKKVISCLSLDEVKFDNIKLSKPFEFDAGRGGVYNKYYVSDNASNKIPIRLDNVYFSFANKNKDDVMASLPALKYTKNDANYVSGFFSLCADEEKEPMMFFMAKFETFLRSSLQSPKLSLTTKVKEKMVKNEPLTFGISTTVATKIYRMQEDGEIKRVPVYKYSDLSGKGNIVAYIDRVFVNKKTLEAKIKFVLSSAMLLSQKAEADVENPFIDANVMYEEE